VLAAVKQIMPSKAADNCDLLTAVLSLCGDVYVGLAHCVDTGLQSYCDELSGWPQETADIVSFTVDESVVSGVYCRNVTGNNRTFCSCWLCSSC